MKQEHTATEKKKRLRSRFVQDSAGLADWVVKARESIAVWTEFTAAPHQTNHRHKFFLQAVALSAELEVKSELKVSVMNTAAQLEQLRTRGGDTAGDAVGQTEDEASVLRQLELDWACLQADLPAIQQTLHTLWMETQSQQEALQEMQVWITAAESGVEERRIQINQNRFTSSDLNEMLKYYKVCQVEMSCHQATLDYVNLPLLPFIICGDHEKCCEQNRFAEEQGGLNHAWLRVQGAVSTQIQEVEQELKRRTERDTCLQQVNGWITEQNIWTEAAERARNRTELQKSLSRCLDLQEEIKHKSAALQEIRGKHCGGDSDFLRRADESLQACEALTQRAEWLHQKWTQDHQLWTSVENKLKDLTLRAVRTSQTMDLFGCPPICLQAHQRLHDRLQLAYQRVAASESELDGLTRLVSTLGGNICPAAAAIMDRRLQGLRSRWTVCVELGERLQRSGSVLQMWQRYTRRVASFSKRLQQLQCEAATPVDISGRDDGVQRGAEHVHTVEALLRTADTLQCDLEEVLQACKELIGHLVPSAAALVQSESRLLSRGVLQLREQLKQKLGRLQEDVSQLRYFGDVLDSLEENLQDWTRRLDAAAAEQSGLLELSGLSADLDVLNEVSCCSPTPGDAEARRLQGLSCGWTAAAARTQEACSKLQTEALRRQSFEQKCRSWMEFLQRMEDSLAVDVSGSYVGLRQQLCTHKRFQAELSIGHQILHSVIAEALQLLQKGEVEDRSDFILKLAQLREHWQGAVQRADQRRSLVEGLMKHWHLYRRSMRKLHRFLADTRTLLPPAGPLCRSLQELRHSLQDLQHTESLFQRYQSSFVHTLEVGRQLFSMGDEETQGRLQSDLGALQEEWERLHSLLGRRTDLTQAVIKTWECCEAELAHSAQMLQDVRTRLERPLTESDGDLQSAQQFNKENEDSLEDWAESLTELSTMKADLSQYIMADDVLLLQEQVEHLHCQWEELCLKVSLRKQEIADRLNAWIIFNEKNKELCEWLTQMENKVAHNSDLNIEEMVEKLKKDCMEEINLFSENKTHLKQLGEQLISASNKTKETEINDKLKDVNDRWCHLFDHIEERVKKLKETLCTVQQLDKNMSNLRTWLSHIEAELAKPVVYNVCHGEEIQRKLAEQQELQRDIEQHTDSVASVLTLCDVLLHDADACGSDSENDSIQQTTRSLDRRWRNICAMSMERRMRIEETWRLWCKFLDDYSRFEDWLKTAELTAANPESANVLYTSAKEELKKFEGFQRQILERLTQLELLNKQYRRLARENRTDASSKLRVLVQDGNQRWDALQKRVGYVLRRLKHFTCQREDFEGTREALLVWLTEMDLQLTNVEHFSESDIEDKMRQLHAFQQEITLNTNKIDALIVFGENLIQKSSPLDAVLIEDELEELHSYCQEVFGRVSRFHQRLVSRRPVLEEERNVPDLDDHSEVLNGVSWTETTARRRTRRPRRKAEEDDNPALGRPAMCHLLPPPMEQSGRETPVSVDSIPLEWDHTVDVGGSSSHEDDDETPFFSALSVKSVNSWELQQTSPERKPLHGYVKLMSECSGSIDRVKRVKLILNDDEELEETGLSCSTESKQTGAGVIERWELLLAQKFGSDSDIRQDLDQWNKLNSDLCDVTSWLGRMLPELERLQRIAPSSSVRDIEGNIRKLKEMQRSFSSYKCLMISVNLSSRHFLHSAGSSELQELQDALSSANQSWMAACSGMESWERKLQAALLQCQEFHKALHALLLFLAEAENKLQSVNVGDSPPCRSVLLQHQLTLSSLQEELRARQQQVSLLQDISSELLLRETGGEDGVEAQEKVHVIGNKLHLLLRRTSTELHHLQEAMETSNVSEICGSAPPPEKEEIAGEQTAAGRVEGGPPGDRPLLPRLLCTAVPLQLLLLLLLLLVCMIPLSDDAYSCTLSNNFARSFYPMLRYTNGPPPT